MYPDALPPLTDLDDEPTTTNPTVRSVADGRLPPPALALAALAPRPPVAGDMKAGLTGDRPRLSLAGARAELYQVRALEYGDEKYARGNYHGAAPRCASDKLVAKVAAMNPELDPAEVRRQLDDALAVIGYLDALMRHSRKITNAFNHAIGVGDLAGARAAIGATDDVASGGFPASGLPDLAHASATMAICVERAVDAGLVPEDPGQPWRAERRDERSPEADARMKAAGR